MSCPLVPMEANDGMGTPWMRHSAQAAICAPAQHSAARELPAHAAAACTRLTEGLSVAEATEESQIIS